MLLWQSAIVIFSHHGKEVSHRKLSREELALKSIEIEEPDGDGGVRYRIPLPPGSTSYRIEVLRVVHGMQEQTVGNCEGGMFWKQ